MAGAASGHGISRMMIFRTVGKMIEKYPADMRAAGMGALFYIDT